MQVTVTSSRMGPDGRARVTFAAKHGSGSGVWRGDKPEPGEVHQVELDILDPIEIGKNAEVCDESEYQIAIDGITIHMTVRIEGADPDRMAYVRLGSDCLFLSEIDGSIPEKGQWLRAWLPCESLELSSYDSGSFDVDEC